MIAGALKKGIFLRGKFFRIMQFSPKNYIYIKFFVPFCNVLFSPKLRGGNLPVEKRLACCISID
jgi:hypothetical protein